jgi:hypothetical protein
MILTTRLFLLKPDIELSGSTLIIEARTNFAIRVP